MKAIFTKSAVILCIIGLAALFIWGLSAPAEDLSPFGTYNAGSTSLYLCYLACFIVIGFSAAWFFAYRKDDSFAHPYRWCRLIPAGAVIPFLHLYYHFNGAVPTDLSGWLDVTGQVLILLCWIAAGIMITRVALARQNPSCPKWKIVLQVLAAVVFVCLAFDRNAFLSGYEWWHVENMYTFVLPLVFWCIAEGLHRSRLPVSRYAVLLRPLYFLLVSGLTAVSVYWYRYSRIFDYDIVQLVYLIVSAVLALWVAESKPFISWFFKKQGRKFYESPLLWTAGMTAGFLCTSERFSDILSSWNAPAEPYIAMPGGYDILEFRNWFAYRWTVLLENLQGCLDSVYKLNANRIPRWNALTWLRHVYGILPVIAAILLLAAVFILLWKCAKNSDRLSRYLYAVLVLRTVLGLIANLLVVYSTEITPLMMGLMPWDVILVIMILWKRPEKTEEILDERQEELI